MPREQGYVHGECPEALRYDEFVSNLRSVQQRSEEIWTSESEPFIFVDGFLLFCDERYLPLYDIKIFLRVSKETCRQRRLSRDPGTSVDYFEKIIWPSYLRWNSIPLGLWESQQTAPDDSQFVEEAKGQQQAEHQASKPSAREGGFFFINGEDDVDTVFRLAVEHITARKHAHLVC